MKRLLLLIGLLGALLSAEGFGQAKSGPFVLTATTSPCAKIQTTGQATVGIVVVGTFSATLQPQVSIQGQPLANVQVAPSTSSTPQSTITAAGTYTAGVAGYDLFSVCATGFVSGSVTIYLNVTTTIAASSVVAAGGAVQSVGGTANQIASSGGANPVLSLPTSVVAPGRISTAINAMGNVTGAALAIDLSKGNLITMTLTGNVTSSSFTNAVASSGQEITFIMTQDATGGRTFVWPTATIPASVAPAPAAAAASVSIFKGVIDGAGNINFINNGGGIVGVSLKLTAQNAAVGSTPLFTPAVAGIYAIYATIVASHASTTVSDTGILTITYTSPYSATGIQIAGNATCTFNANLNSNGQLLGILSGKAATAVNYAVAGTQAGTGWTYDLDIVAVRIE